MRRAHADLVVLRTDLREPGRKAQIRVQLRDALAKLGHVESIERFIAEPPDGPFRDGTLGEFDWDRFTLIRVIGYVTPFRGQQEVSGLR